MAATHRFEAHLSWRRSAGSVGTGTHEVTLADRPPFQVSAAPQYRGDPSKPNPEELFVTALASCQALTYLALAGRAGVDVVAYDDHAEGTVTMADRRMRVTEVVLRPRITLAPGSDPSKGRALVDAAHDGCFIANSVACAVRIEPDVVVATGAERRRATP